MMKKLPEIISNVLTALVLAGVVVFGLYQAFTPAMMETATGWLHWLVRDVLYWLLIAATLVGGIVILWLAGRAGISDVLSSYRVTLIDEEREK